MKRIKTILASVLSAAMLLSLAACGSGNDTSSTAASSSKASGKTTAQVFIYDYSDEYITTVRTQMAKDLEDAGIDATFNDAANTQSKQSEQITTAISQGVDLLIVNIVTTGSDDAAQSIVDEAKEAGIPLIFFNREVSDEVVKSYDKCAFVGTDPDEAGYMQGDMIYEYLKKNFDAVDLNKDGKIQYIMFKGELGNAEADGRTKYSIERANEKLEADGLGTLEFYDSSNADLYLAGDWDQATAQDLMATALETNSFTGDNPIEMVIANNDSMALGAVTALQAVGYNESADGNRIPVFGVDATDAAKESISKGGMDGSIAQSATNMSAAVAGLAKSIADGNDLMADVNETFLDDVNAEQDSGVNKIRIHYEIYTG